MKKKVLFYLFLLLFISSQTVYAHKMLIAPDEEGAIQVIYEDGSFSTRTVVTVFDKDGNEVDQGRLDSEGFFYYDQEVAHSFVADDGIGHRSEWVIGEEVVATADLHRWILIGVVVTVLVGIAVVFSIRSKRRNDRTVAD